MPKGVVDSAVLAAASGIGMKLARLCTVTPGNC